MMYEQSIRVDGHEARVLSDRTRRYDALTLARMFFTGNHEEDPYWRRESLHGRVKWETYFRPDGTRATELFHVGEHIGHIEH